MAGPGLIRDEAHSLLVKFFRLSRRVSQLGKKRGYRDFFPIDAKKVVEQALEWKIRPLDNYDQRAKCDFQQRVIFMNLNGTTPGEQSFSIAHEIGHARLHIKDFLAESEASARHDIIECYGGSLNRPLRSAFRGLNDENTPEMIELETEADQFAADLLMPPRPVREHFKLIFNTIPFRTSSDRVLSHTALGIGASPYDVAYELAAFKPSAHLSSLVEQFGTSRKAMARRLVNLGLVRR